MPSKNEAESQTIRSRYGITHVLSVYPNVDASRINLPPSQHLILKVEDDDSSDLLREFSTTYDFIEGASLDNGIVLVHCAQGISRSSTVVAAYCASNLIQVTRKVMLASSDTKTSDDCWRGARFHPQGYATIFSSRLGPDIIFN